MIPPSPLGPRPALAAAVLLLLLAAALVGPVAADTEIPLDATVTGAYTYYNNAAPPTAEHPAVLYITPDDSAYYILSLYAPAMGGLDRIYVRGGASSSPSPSSHAVYITFNSQVIGTGSVDCFNVYTGGLTYPILDLQLDPGFKIAASGHVDVCIWTTDGTRLSQHDAYLPSGTLYSGYPGVAVPADYYTSVTGDWHAKIRVVNDRYFYLDRNLNGSAYYSTVTLTSGSDVILQDQSYNDIYTPFPKYPLTYSVVDSFGQYWNGTIESESPSNPGGTFSLSLSPQTAPIGEPVTATLTAAAGAPAYDEIAWVHSDEQRTFCHNASGWWEFNYQTYEYDLASTEAAAHNYQFTTDSPPGLDPPQDQVRCLVYSGGKLVQELIGRVPLTENVAKTQLAVVVIDYSGGDTPILSGAAVSVKDEISKASIPAASVDSTFHRFNVERGRRYIISASAPGFVSSSRTVSAAGEIQTVEMYLSRDAPVTVPDNSTQVDFLVKDPKNTHLGDVQITLTDQTTGQAFAGLTNAYGTRTFVVDKRRLYQFSVSKSGYQGTSGILDPASVGTRVFVLYPDGTGPGGTPPVTVTPDRRTNKEKAQSAVDMLANSVEAITGLGLIATVMGLMYLMQPGGGRRGRRRR